MFSTLVRRALSSSSTPKTTNAYEFPPLDKMLLPKHYKARLHAAESVKLWKKINIFLSIPIVVLVAVYTLPTEYKHIQHAQEHGPEEHVPFAYLRKRKSEFFFGDGDHTAFHNKYVNSDPPPEE